jgi:aminopeptidase N
MHQMRTDAPPRIRLQDYAPFPFRIEEVRLTFRLSPDATHVHSRLKVRRTGAADAALRLDGEKLNLVRIALDGAPIPEGQYQVDVDGLTLNVQGDAFELDIETEIDPQANTELSGLYVSSGRFCTQCEAEGFRRITYYPDRPDVLSTFFVRIEADRTSCPYLLSNGNPGDRGRVSETVHFVEWFDPHPKPSYLFALVGGDFDVLEDSFRTRSGREVALSIYVEKGDAPRARFAMDSLKHAMTWDEDVFGREYDLDVFQIVAVRDFNFGAMENKGLNIFNSAYVLADVETASDADFEAIESIVAHEYFHNWTGNRITCRDWFQLCLKEGLTVYRDQEFTKSMRSPAVTRIKEVNRLRARQFPEDAGPLAHPVRPDSYARIDNLYTATVYEKGAELIRMLRLIIGEEAFFAGMNRYFDANDGRAATVEDFLASFQPSTRLDLAAFATWYAQAGTPEVAVHEVYHPASASLTLTLSQRTRPTPGQPEKGPQVVPLRVALIGSNGARLTSVHAGALADEHVLLLDRASREFRLDDVRENPVVSLNRGFSAPVRIAVGDRSIPLSKSAGLDDDPFCQWDQLQSAARALILADSGHGDIEDARGRRADYLEAATLAVGRAAHRDPAFAALLLQVPPVGELVVGLSDVDPDRIHRSRLLLRRALAQNLEPLLVSVIDADQSRLADLSAASANQRALISMSLSVLSTLESGVEARIRRAFDQASTMTIRLSALSALSMQEGPGFDAALDAFRARWSNAPTVMDKWFSVQAASLRTDLRGRLERLAASPEFDLRNPNRVRALAASFAMSNPVAFHAADGWGYRFLSDIIRKVDPMNPALSARLATAFEAWRAFDAPRRKQAEACLKDLEAGQPSKNALDIITRALADPEGEP